MNKILKVLATASIVMAMAATAQASVLSDQFTPTNVPLPENPTPPAPPASNPPAPPATAQSETPRASARAAVAQDDETSGRGEASHSHHRSRH